jgi:hypothetical protein
MKISSLQHAREHAIRSIRTPDSIATCVVTESGDVMANCDVDETCDELEKTKTTFFLVKGERSSKKRKSEEAK